MIPTSLGFELIPLSPIACPDAKSDPALCADNPTSPFQTLMRGNTLIGAARTVLQSSLRRRPDDADPRGGLWADLPLRCSDIAMPREAPVMQGVAINLRRQSNLLSALAEPSSHAFVGMELAPTRLPRVTIGMSVDPKNTLLTAFAATCNQFFRPQWDSQRALLERHARSAGQRYLFDIWLDDSRRRWLEYDIAQQIHAGTGFLMRLGRWAGCESRTHNNKSNPRQVRSRRSTRGRYTERRTPKTWWVVTADEPDSLKNAAPLQCAPIGWVFLRLIGARRARAPSAAVNDRVAAARLAQQWSVYPDLARDRSDFVAKGHARR